MIATNPLESFKLDLTRSSKTQGRDFLGSLFSYMRHTVINSWDIRVGFRTPELEALEEADEILSQLDFLAVYRIESIKHHEIMAQLERINEMSRHHQKVLVLALDGRLWNCDIKPLLRNYSSIKALSLHQRVPSFIESYSEKCIRMKFNT